MPLVGCPLESGPVLLKGVEAATNKLYTGPFVV